MSETIDRFDRVGAAETSAKTKAAPSAPAAAAAADRNLAVGYMRAFVTLLVLAHHALIAYIGGLPKPPAVFGQPPFTWGAFPVLDTATFAPFGALVGVNDTFFMSLMFFISGLFVLDSLSRKGAWAFLRDRVIRLGIPFAVCASLLAPLAYYPSYLLTGANPSPLAFAKAWISLSSWPAGPAWFIWVLLVFGALAAAAYQVAPRVLAALGAPAANAEAKPLRFFLVLLGASMAAYAALAVVFGPLAWLAFGPFSVQAARILHYLVYFAAGIGVGAVGLARGLLSPHGALQRRWWVWLCAAPVAVAISAVLGLAGLIAGRPNDPVFALMGAVGFTIGCATLCLTVMAVFARFVRRRSAIWDSLSANAYGMYLVHYVFVTWIQFSLLRSALPGYAKGLLVTLSVIALSWLVAAGLRRLPGLRRVL
jgi:peptidoglycan/LPS O-acetylase OafA/YrhL